MPYKPYDKFKKEWKGWSDYLGANIVAPQKKDRNFYVSYDELKEILKKNNVTTSKKWRKFRKKNKRADIPSHPDQLYKEWISWGELFGTGSRSHKQFVSYKKAKEIIQKLNIKTQKEYKKFTKTKEFKLLNIPTNPNRYKEFEGLGIFLGKI